MLQSIFGAFPATGEIRLDGEAVRFRSVRQAMRAGIAYVPEERGTQAAFLDLSVRQNLSAADVSRFWRGARLRHREEGRAARASIDEFLIKAHSEAQPINTLSGGNQQKCVVARWMRREPKVLLLDEPTQGVDVGARAEIYSLVTRAVENGASAVVVTSDFEELARVCDRVVVLAGGRIAAEVAHPNIEPHRLTELAFSQADAPASRDGADRKELSS